jgi:hypothetical protein
LFQGRTFVVKIAVHYDCDLPWRVTGLDTLVPPMSTSTRVASVADDAWIQTQSSLHSGQNGGVYSHHFVQIEFFLSSLHPVARETIAEGHIDSCNFVLLH